MDKQELHLVNFNCVSRFKSVRRAINRGLLTEFGYIAPKRPFNSRKRTKGRKFQLIKERYYADITRNRI